MFCQYLYCFLLGLVSCSLCNLTRLLLSLQLAAAGVMDASVAGAGGVMVTLSERLYPSAR